MTYSKKKKYTELSEIQDKYITQKYNELYNSVKYELVEIVFSNKRDFNLYLDKTGLDIDTSLKLLWIIITMYIIQYPNITNRNPITIKGGTPGYMRRRTQAEILQDREEREKKEAEQKRKEGLDSLRSMERERLNSEIDRVKFRTNSTLRTQIDMLIEYTKNFLLIPPFSKRQYVDCPYYLQDERVNPFLKINQIIKAGECIQGLNIEDILKILSEHTRICNKTNELIKQIYDGRIRVKIDSSELTKNRTVTSLISGAVGFLAMPVVFAAKKLLNVQNAPEETDTLPEILLNHNISVMEFKTQLENLKIANETEQIIILYDFLLDHENTSLDDILLPKKIRLDDFRDQLNYKPSGINPKLKDVFLDISTYLTDDVQEFCKGRFITEWGKIIRRYGSINKINLLKRLFDEYEQYLSSPEVFNPNSYTIFKRFENMSKLERTAFIKAKQERNLELKRQFIIDFHNLRINNVIELDNYIHNHIPNELKLSMGKRCQEIEKVYAVINDAIINKKETKYNILKIAYILKLPMPDETFDYERQLNNKFIDIGKNNGLYDPSIFLEKFCDNNPDIYIEMMQHRINSADMILRTDNQVIKLINIIEIGNIVDKDYKKLILLKIEEAFIIEYAKPTDAPSQSVEITNRLTIFGKQEFMVRWRAVLAQLDLGRKKNVKKIIDEAVKHVIRWLQLMTKKYPQLENSKEEKQLLIGYLENRFPLCVEMINILLNSGKDFYIVIKQIVLANNLVVEFELDPTIYIKRIIEINKILNSESSVRAMISNEKELISKYKLSVEEIDTYFKQCEFDISKFKVRIEKHNILLKLGVRNRQLAEQLLVKSSGNLEKAKNIAIAENLISTPPVSAARGLDNEALRAAAAAEVDDLFN